MAAGRRCTLALLHCVVSTLNALPLRDACKWMAVPGTAATSLRSHRALWECHSQRARGHSPLPQSCRSGRPLAGGTASPCAAQAAASSHPSKCFPEQRDDSHQQAAAREQPSDERSQSQVKEPRHNDKRRLPSSGGMATGGPASEAATAPQVGLLREGATVPAGQERQQWSSHGAERKGSWGCVEDMLWATWGAAPPRAPAAASSRDQGRSRSGTPPLHHKARPLGSASTRDPPRQEEGPHRNASRTTERRALRALWCADGPISLAARGRFLVRRVPTWVCNELLLPVVVPRGDSHQRPGSRITPGEERHRMQRKPSSCTTTWGLLAARHQGTSSAHAFACSAGWARPMGIWLVSTWGATSLAAECGIAKAQRQPAPCLRVYIQQVGCGLEEVEEVGRELHVVCARPQQGRRVEDSAAGRKELGGARGGRGDRGARGAVLYCTELCCAVVSCAGPCLYSNALGGGGPGSMGSPSRIMTLWNLSLSKSLVSANL